MQGAEGGAQHARRAPPWLPCVRAACMRVRPRTHVLDGLELLGRRARAQHSPLVV